MAEELPAKRVRGTISDGDGVPLAGARVSATREGVSIETVAGDDGAYELELAPFPHVLEAACEGHCRVRITIDVSCLTWQPDFLLARESALRGVVVDRETGARVPRAQVTVVDGKAFRNTTECDEHGAFLLRGARDGSAAITARTPRHASREATRVELAPGRSLDEIEVVVDRTFAIRGRVVDRGQPQRGIEGARVRVTSVANQPFVTSDPDGRFEIVGLTPGEYTIGGPNPGTVLEERSVTIRDADVEVEITTRPNKTITDATAAPDIFHRLEFVVARERALTARKLLLVDATAEWCGPCKMMDRTTWVDQDVITWVRDHAVAIQIDVDAEKDLARELRVTAMPTIIAFVDGAEFDRVVGAKKPKELLAWLEGVTRGETSLVAHKRQVLDEPVNVDARLALARELTRAGRFDEAIIEHVWLWEHMLEHAPAMYGVRLSFFAHDLTTLVNAHAPARAAIAALRDRAAPPDEGAIAVESFRDWVCLNGVLGDAAGRALAWYDALPAARRASLDSGLLEHDIIPLLIAAGRWGDAGALYPNPLATVDREAESLRHTERMATERDLPPRLLALSRRSFRSSLAQLVRALRAAGRDADVDSVERRALEVDPSEDMMNALARARTT